MLVDTLIADGLTDWSSDVFVLLGQPPVPRPMPPPWLARTVLFYFAGIAVAGLAAVALAAIGYSQAVSVAVAPVLRKWTLGAGVTVIVGLAVLVVGVIASAGVVVAVAAALLPEAIVMALLLGGLLVRRVCRMRQAQGKDSAYEIRLADGSPSSG